MIEVHQGTEYNIRLVSGRVVVPGPGGFFWYRASGVGAGSSMGFDHVVSEFLNGAYGGVGIAWRYGAHDSVAEVIPVSQIEAIVRREPFMPTKTEGPYR